MKKCWSRVSPAWDAQVCFMKKVSDLNETIEEAFLQENLPPPASVPWPLTGEQGEDCRRREAAFRQALANQPPPGLAWISRHADAKYNPGAVLDGARGVLVTWLSYYRDDPSDPAASAGSKGLVARYARGRDYHKELGNRLKRVSRRLSKDFPGQEFRSFTDIGPLDETWLIETSGVGFIGRHSLAILPGVGSWVVLGHIVTTLELSADSVSVSPASCPEGCRRCIEACPTGALSLSRGLNPEACLSYQTVEHPGAGDPALREAAGNRVFGCDACQEACPFNAKVPITEVAAFKKDIAGPWLSLRSLLALKSHDDMVSRFAGSPLMRAGRAGLVRNAAIAAGNSGDSQLIPLLEALRNDEEPGVRDAACWALGRLRSRLRGFRKS